MQQAVNNHSKAKFMHKTQASHTHMHHARENLHWRHIARQEKDRVSQPASQQQTDGQTGKETRDRASARARALARDKRQDTKKAETEKRCDRQTKKAETEKRCKR